MVGLWLRELDLLDRRERDGQGQGREPHTRVSVVENASISTRSPVKFLPRNVYDAAWWEALTAVEQRGLEAQDEDYEWVSRRDADLHRAAAYETHLAPHRVLGVPPGVQVCYAVPATISQGPIDCSLFVLYAYVSTRSQCSLAVQSPYASLTSTSLRESRTLHSLHSTGSGVADSLCLVS